MLRRHRALAATTAAAALLGAAGLAAVQATGSIAAPNEESKDEKPLVVPDAGPTPLTATAATIQRTFVSTSGNDGNPCTPAAPCRSFQAAIANTSPGGEVVALDSFGYGVFTVDRAITIAGAPGRHVAITAFTETGVHVNAGENDAVILRKLYVTGLGGETGIFFQAGRTLHLESAVVSGFASAGLRDRHRRRPDPPQAQLPTQRRKRRLRVRRSPGADRGQPGRPGRPRPSP